ncbi:MAG: hypothetical protein Q8905_14720 [Bacteroidota bacterium]|nr:hypothetical protein [Bacteroidota bacterium]
MLSKFTQYVENINHFCPFKMTIIYKFTDLLSFRALYGRKISHPYNKSKTNHPTRFHPHFYYFSPS